LRLFAATNRFEKLLFEEEHANKLRGSRRSVNIFSIAIHGSSRDSFAATSVNVDCRAAAEYAAVVARALHALCRFRSEDVWTNPTFQKILLGGLAWSFRNVEFDPRPNLAEKAPGARVMPPPKGAKKPTPTAATPKAK
jgi:hypothetical protein